MRLRTANNHRRSAASRAFRRYWMTLTDNCQVCLGTKGGVRGNENRIGGLVACDYCSADGSADRAAARDDPDQVTAS